MFEILLEVLLEGLLQVIVEVILELTWHGLLGKLSERRAHPILAFVVVFLLGAAIGLAFVAVAPNRVLPFGRIPGASLVLSPLLAGVIMEYFGRWRRARGGSPSLISTFWGGALFAFGLALTRFLLVPAMNP
jgi:hypothetical protein